MYLSPSLNISRMYRLYLEKCRGTQSEPVKEAMYRSIFRTKFNRAFHAPMKDTCRKCDAMKTSIEAKTDADAKKHLLHLSKAEGARQSLRAEEQNKNQDYEAFSFDLQKVFLLPCLTTGEAYYCRQLSAYNLGIHNLSG